MINNNIALTKRGIIVFLVTCLPSLLLTAQTVEPFVTDSEMEYAELIADREEETDIDDLIPDLKGQQRININEADAAQLRSIGLLTEEQINAFIQHRENYGELLSKYELQAIEGWDLETIRRLIPMITLEIHTSLKIGFKDRLTKGHSMLLIRYSTLLEKTSGSLTDSLTALKKFMGGQGRMLVRYRYNYKNLFQYNFLAEKDPGERMSFRSFKLFDFNSLNLSLQKPFRWCDQLVIGDYAISMGQGLIQWQGFGFSKGSGSMNIKKQGPTLKSYGSSGEINFHRGIAAKFRTNNVQALFFISNRKIDANIEEDTVRSILNSGLHRDQNENDDRRSLGLMVGGVQVVTRIRKVDFGLNAVYYSFSKPLLKNDEPYNLFSIKGNKWNNISINYSRTIRNIHLFGEWAVDKNLSMAQLHGFILTAHKNVDVSFLYRNISSRYQSLYSRAFTENTLVNNENGIYAAVSLKFRKFKIDIYEDLFHFPWVKYRVDAPSLGHEYSAMLTWNPSKNVEWILRYKYEKKQLNDVSDSIGTKRISDVFRINYRAHLNWNYSRQLLFRFRMESNRYNNGIVDSKGFLAFAESHYKFIEQPVTAVLRLQYFEADDFNSRVYAFENDVQYSFSVPFFSDNGWRYFITARFTPSNQFIRKYLKNHDFHLSLKWSQSFFPFEKTNGSGPNLIIGNKRSEIKLQLILERTG